jgi:protein-tyrosine kinase
LTLEDRVNVMLVDGDVIRPSVHTLFGVDGKTGLTDYLRVRDSDMSPYLWRAENAPLTVLPAGSSVQAPRELFRSDEMSRFIYDVSSRYSDRLVIVDTPPLLITAEAPVLANHADQILLVVQASRTSQTAVEDALDLLQAHDNVSMILNRCNEGDRLTASGYYGYGYGYYQKRAELNLKEKQS